MIGLYGKLNKSSKVELNVSLPDQIGHGSLDYDGNYSGEEVQGGMMLGGGDSYRKRRLKQVQMSSEF